MQAKRAVATMLLVGAIMLPQLGTIQTTVYKPTAPPPSALRVAQITVIKPAISGASIWYTNR